MVGEAREGMDGEGVGIDVEEAILEVSPNALASVAQLRTGTVGLTAGIGK